MNPKPRSEKEITASIRAFLRAHGIFHWKVFQTLGSQKGVSDIIGIYERQFFACEVKREDALSCPYACKHKQCREQAKFLNQVVAVGGIGFVARSLDDVVEHLGMKARF